MYAHTTYTRGCPIPGPLQVLPPPAPSQPHQVQDSPAAAAAPHPPTSKLPPPTPGLKAAAVRVNGKDGPEFPLELARSNISSSGSASSGGSAVPPLQQRPGHGSGAGVSNDAPVAGARPETGPHPPGPGAAAGAQQPKQGGTGADAEGAAAAAGAAASVRSGQQGSGQSMEAAEQQVRAASRPSACGVQNERTACRVGRQKAGSMHACAFC